MSLRRLFPLLAVLALLPLGACTTGDELPGPGTPDAAASSPDAGGDGGLLPFMSPCTENAECETGLCFAFNAAGPHCSHSCTVDEDCEEPSPGCNGMGICKRPQ